MKIYRQSIRVALPSHIIVFSDLLWIYNYTGTHWNPESNQRAKLFLLSRSFLYYHDHQLAKSFYKFYLAAWYYIGM